jgi:hypothetical protein
MRGVNYSPDLEQLRNIAFNDESDLHNAIIDYCRSKGWIYLHGSMAHRTFRSVGEWDFTIVADKGRTFFVECKKTGGKLTKEQAGLHAWAVKLGHVVHTVYCMEEFVKLVE